MLMLAWKTSKQSQLGRRIGQALSHAHSYAFASPLSSASSSFLLQSDSIQRKRQSQTPIQIPSIRLQCRDMSMLPEALQNITIWGGSAYFLKSFHAMGFPHYAGFSLTQVMLRLSLSPLVLKSAHTAARFAKVAPEVQFLVTLFQNDLKKQRQEGASSAEQRSLIFKTMQTLSAIYKLHKINPLAVFLSPFLQLPFFWYMSIDLRKIINGADPELAQQLTEGGIFWFKDLTEPDVWYALPVLGGLLLYYNVEVAVGKQSLSGETAAKSNVAFYLKDFFQSLAVFMPCFMSQAPAGIQIYICTSIIFTYFQSQALRNDSFRGMVGLPLRSTPGLQPPEAKYAQEFIELKQLELKAKEARGDSEVLGKGVLMAGLEASFVGTNRPSTIQGSGIIPYASVQNKAPHVNVAPPMPVGNHPFVHGVSAPPEQLRMDNLGIQNDQKIVGNADIEKQSQDNFVQERLEIDMERANLGQPPIQVVGKDSSLPSKPVDVKRFKKALTKRKKK